MSILEIQYGGTSASNVFDARRNLGLVIGDDIQPFSVDISAIAALSGTGYLKKTASNTWALDPLDSQNLIFSGDVTGSGIGTINITINDTGVIADTYTKVTVNSKGQVISGSSLLESDIPSISWSKIISTPNTLSGYGISDAQPLSNILTSISNLSITIDSFIYFEDSIAIASTITPLSRQILSKSNAIDIRSLLGLTIGTDIQEYDEDLSAIAALSGTGYLRKTASNIWTLDPLDSQNLIFSGDVTGSGIGTINITINDTGVIADTYTKVTVNSKGQVIFGSSLLESDIPSISWSKIISTPNTLSGYGISDAQPLSNILTSISNLSITTDSFIYFEDSIAITSTITPLSRQILSKSNAIDIRSLLGLTIGTDIQEYDEDLSAIAALDGIGYLKKTGSNTWSVDNNLDDLEITLENTGLADFLNQFSGNYVPTEPGHLVTKSYVDNTFISSISGIDPVVVTNSLTPTISINLATTSTDGLLSSQDKAKLDSLINSNYTHPNHSGDVVSVGDGAQTIVDDVVTFAKLQNIDTQTIIGRNTSGTGDPEQVSITTLKSMLSLGSAAYTASTDYAAVSHTHNNVTTYVAGFMSPLDKTKLNSLSNYTHPTTDGFLHVPATSTTNNGKVLTAGGTPGAISWEDPVSSVSALTDVSLSDLTSGDMLIYDGSSWVNQESANSSASIVKVYQESHGLSVGNIIRVSNDNTYIKAQANSLENAEVVGYVSQVIDSNTFVYTITGLIETGIPVATAGTVFFLDPNITGAITSTEPTDINTISKPVLIIVESGSKAILLNMRGIENSISEHFAFKHVFTNADLVAGVLTITHNLGFNHIMCQVFDNNGLVVIPDEIDCSSINEIVINLSSFGTITGSWIVLYLQLGADYTVNLGSMAAQNASSVSITGGSVSDTDINIDYDPTSYSLTLEPSGNIISHFNGIDNFLDTLGSIATQASDNVSITGGSISGTDITFTTGTVLDTTAGVVRLVSYVDTILSGTPKVFSFVDSSDNWYYIKAYPSALNCTAEGVILNVNNYSDTTLSGTPKIFTIRSLSDAQYYFKAYPNADGVIETPNEALIKLYSFSYSSLSGEPKVFVIYDSFDTPYYFKAYPIR